MYLSVRRSQHALYAIGFFVVMILTVFSTLLYVLFLIQHPILRCCSLLSNSVTY
jgi:hypothetical protein